FQDHAAPTHFGLAVDDLVRLLELGNWSIGEVTTDVIVQGSDLKFDFAGLQNIIGIQKLNELSRRASHTEIPCRRRTCIVLPQHADQKLLVDCLIGSPALDSRRGRIYRAVVDDYQLYRPIGLGTNGLQGFDN